MRRPLFLAGLLVLGAAGRARPEPAPMGAELLQRAAARMGLEELTRRGFVQLAYEGTIDESAYMQSLEPSRESVQQTFAFDLARDAFGWESRGHRGDGSVRWRRFTYPEPDVRLVVELNEKWASAVRSPAYRQERLRTARVLPHLVVREALRRLSTVRPLPPATSAGRTLAGVSFATAAGEVLDLRFDEDGLLARVETWLAVPFLGDRKCAWEYTAWRREGGIAIPGRRRMRVGDRAAEDLILQSVDWSRSGRTVLDVAWFPGPRILFQGDLFYPAPLAEFPSPNRQPIMAWFAGWLERQGLEPERIYSTHGDGAATREHLDKLRAGNAAR